MSDSSTENGGIKTCMLWFAGIAVVILALVGLIFLIKSIMFFISVGIDTSSTITFDRGIVGAVMAGVFLLVLLGFFITKTPGFGRFTTSTLLITLALMVASVGLMFGDVSGDDITKIIIAVVGFAGGLLARKDKNDVPKE